MAQISGTWNCTRVFVDPADSLEKVLTFTIAITPDDDPTKWDALLKVNSMDTLFHGVLDDTMRSWKGTIAHSGVVTPIALPWFDFSFNAAENRLGGYWRDEAGRIYPWYGTLATL